MAYFFGPPCICATICATTTCSCHGPWVNVLLRHQDKDTMSYKINLRRQCVHSMCLETFNTILVMFQLHHNVLWRARSIGLLFCAPFSWREQSKSKTKLRRKDKERWKCVDADRPTNIYQNQSVFVGTIACQILASFEAVNIGDFRNFFLIKSRLLCFYCYRLAVFFCFVSVPFLLPFMVANITEVALWDKRYTEEAPVQYEPIKYCIVEVVKLWPAPSGTYCWSAARDYALMTNVFRQRSVISHVL